MEYCRRAQRASQVHKSDSCCPICSEEVEGSTDDLAHHVELCLRTQVCMKYESAWF